MRPRREIRESEGQEERVLKTVTMLSDSGSWLSSLVGQLCDYREEQKHPSARLRITAEKDFSALDKLVEMRSPFLSLANQLREMIDDRRHPRHIETTARPVIVPELWTKHRAAVPRMLSLLAHVCLIALVLIPWTAPMRTPSLTATSIILVADGTPSLSLPDPGISQGGGGGGKHALTPASLGRLPRSADKQFVPPAPESPKNLDPSLVMEPTVIGPQLASDAPLKLLNIGDPNGVAGPPSSGPGSGGGIGTGAGRGVGEGSGPGVGPGDGGGLGGGIGDGRDGGNVYQTGSGVTAPVLIHEVLPQFSEEARKARFQGTVLLQTIVRRDGSVQVIHVVRSLGYGLDDEAIRAAEQWVFAPGMKNGRPVDVPINIEVTFNLK